jgi:hypothetical protein
MGNLKGTVYQDVPTAPEDMRQRIVDDCAARNPQVTERSRQSFVRRLQLCIDGNGQHFEHRLLAHTTKLFIQVDISSTWFIAFYVL